MTTIRELAKLAFPELLERALAGELSPASVWLAVTGAAKYAEAVARGDIATLPVQADRAARCRECPVRTERPMNGSAGTVGYCGTPFENRPDAALPSCGCLTTCTIDGVVYAAGKTVVGSERCPGGRW